MILFIFVTSVSLLHALIKPVLLTFIDYFFVIPSHPLSNITILMLLCQCFLQYFTCIFVSIQRRILICLTTLVVLTRKSCLKKPIKWVETWSLTNNCDYLMAKSLQMSYGNGSQWLSIKNCNIRKLSSPLAFPLRQAFFPPSSFRKQCKIYIWWWLCMCRYDVSLAGSRLCWMWFSLVGNPHT